MSVCSAPTCVRLRGNPQERLEFLGEITDRWVRELGRLPLPPGNDLRDVVGRIQREVQSLPYCPDSEGAVDFVETDLARALRRCNDCKLRSMVIAAYSSAYGCDARLAWQTQDGPVDHVTAQVWLDGDWRWVDGTVTGAEIGEEPRTAARRLGMLVFS